MNYQLQEKENCLAVVFPSDLDTVNEVVRDAVDFISRRNAIADRFSFKLGLFEGLVNAVKHGNKCDASLKVFLDIEISGNAAFVKIKDSGPGFDWRKMLKRSSRTPLAAHGRGILLLKSFACNPSYNESGTELSMRFDFQEKKQD